MEVKHSKSKGPVIDPNATTRVELKPGKKATNSDLQHIIGDWTANANPNGSKPFAFVYKLPADLDPKTAVVELAKRVPMLKESWIDDSKFPDVELRVTDKQPASVMPLLESLATSQDNNVAGILKPVIPYLRKAEASCFGGIIVSHNKDGSQENRYDGEFLALINTTSKEVVFLLAGNLFPGVYVGES